MKNIFKAIKEILLEIYYGVKFIVESNLYNLGVLIEISMPYIMWYVGIKEFQRRGYFAIGGELFIPLFLLLLSSILKKIANRKGKGYRLPIARKRFTIEGEDGEVSVAETDIQEIILYLNDVENYIEKRGWSKWV